VVHEFDQHDRERVGFLARGAARNPYTHLVLAAFAVEQPGQDDVFNQLERRAVTKKAGDADQQVAEQQDHLVLVPLQQLQIGVGTLGRDVHPALHPAKKRLFLILAEIMADLFTQNSAYFLA
jgi:hypothetical protein